MEQVPKAKVVVVISANAEWDAVKQLLPNRKLGKSPFGEWFLETAGRIQNRSVLFFQGGWGKISAAASAQYIIDHCQPDLLVNLGTCGGFDGMVHRGTMILAKRTVVYDIIEQMGDPVEHLNYYTTDLDLTWLAHPYPSDVLPTLLVSGDRDLLPDDARELGKKYGAVAGDWESGAIAWTAARNGVKCLILRGVTDLVGPNGGEAYDGRIDVYLAGTAQVLQTLLAALPRWLDAAAGAFSRKARP